MKIAIVDDFSQERDVLGELLARYSKNHKIETETLLFNSGEEFIEKAQLSEIDVLFLDIYMNKISGMDVAQHIRRCGCQIPIVFLTTSKEHALQSYEVRAFDYILKPLSAEKLSATMERLNKSLDDVPRYIKVKEAREYKKVMVSDVIYIDYHNHYVQIHTANSVVKTYRKFADFELEMNEFKCFLTCHRSIMINMDMVERVEKGLFIMKNNEVIPINRKFIKEVKSKYLDYVFGEASNG